MSQEAEDVGELRATAFAVVSEGRYRWGSQAKLGLASQNNFSRLCSGIQTWVIRVGGWGIANMEVVGMWALGGLVCI